MNRSPQPEAPDGSRPEHDLLQFAAESALVELDQLELPSSECVYSIGKLIQVAESLLQNERLLGGAGRFVIGRQSPHRAFAHY
jgi:hypothetical protein